MFKNGLKFHLSCIRTPILFYLKSLPAHKRSFLLQNFWFGAILWSKENNFAHGGFLKEIVDHCLPSFFGHFRYIVDFDDANNGWKTILLFNSNDNSVFQYFNHFRPYFHQLYVHLSQCWGSDGHFKVLNWSES